MLPLVAGLTGDSFYDPVAMDDGFHMAMDVCAGLAALGGIIAWLTIRTDVLEDEPGPGGRARARRTTRATSAEAALRPGREPARAEA